MKIIQALIICTILVSCTPTNLSEPTDLLPSPTSSASPYPPCAPFFNSSIPTSMPTLQLELSNSLILKEYQGHHDFQEQESGCRYAYRDRVHITEITLNNSFQVVIKPIRGEKERVVVLDNDEKVFETEISTYVYSGLLEAWGYDNHWVIEFVTTDVNRVPPRSDIIDIVRDGVSLKEENNYKDVFAFQLLDGKPLYFFKRYDNTFGLNYDGSEIQLDYNDIAYDNPHPGFDKSIIQYQNMVLFSAEKEGVWRSVAIGVFNK